MTRIGWLAFRWWEMLFLLLLEIWFVFIDNILLRLWSSANAILFKLSSTIPLWSSYTYLLRPIILDHFVFPFLVLQTYSKDQYFSCWWFKLEYFLKSYLFISCHSLSFSIDYFYSYSKTVVLLYLPLFMLDFLKLTSSRYLTLNQKLFKWVISFGVSFQ